MNLSKKSLLSIATILALSSVNTVFAKETDKNTTALDSVEVIANDNITEDNDSYTISSMSTSTKMNLSPLETPQSVSVVTSQQMKDFDLTTIDNVLDNVTGIEVERVESDRTRYTSRGFNIGNFLIDGVGSSMINNYSNGDIDMFLYDHVEVTRGATGLTNNHGDPSAAVNLIRKRPKKEFSTGGKVSIGSWHKKRAEVDVSTPLNESKTIRARILGATEDTDSYLDRYQSKSNVISAIVDADIADNTIVTFGITHEQDDNDGSQMGGFDSTDLKKNNYDRSTNVAPDWAYRNTENTESFLEIKSALSDKWKIKGTYTYKDGNEDNEVLVPSTSSGVTTISRTMKGDIDSKTNIFDITLDGTYSLFGKEHEAVFGLNYTKQDYKEYLLYDWSNTGYVIDLDSWNGSTPYRTYDPANAETTDWTIKEKSFLAATNYHITDDLTFLIGSKFSSFEKDGINWAGNISQKDSSVFTPYASLLYKINDSLSVYTSYTTTYNPQNYVNSGGSQLDPEEGINYEAGVKSSFFNGALNTSFAIFKTKKENVAESAGKFSNGKNFYKAIDGVTSKGYELEIAGNITDNLITTFGFTSLSIENAQGKDVNLYIPRKMLNTSITYSPEAIPGLRVGASANWKSKMYHSNYPDVVQKAYAIYNLMASYEINKKLKLSFNVNNLTDEKYYSSLMKFGYTVYGAPRSYGVALEYKF